MRVVIAHNYYKQPGGEDRIVQEEAALLARFGCEVHTFTRHSNDIDSVGPRLAAATMWNRQAYGELRGLVRNVRADVVHFHNTLPLISPSGYYAARAEGAAVVQTVHNYRINCLNGLLYRDGSVCTDCLGRRVSWPGVVHACYRDSRAASTVVAATLAGHRAVGTWRGRIDAYIAMTRFAAQLLGEAGVPPDRVHVKPHFLGTDPGVGNDRDERVLFVGRLSPEKGVEDVLDAWTDPSLPRLQIVGDGPLRELARAAAAERGNVDWLGFRPNDQVVDLMKRAALLVFPSRCFETFGITLIEAMAVGLPVIATDLGGRSETVRHEETGWLVESGNPAALRSAVLHASGRPEVLRRTGAAARRSFEAKYTAEVNWTLFQSIYRAVVGQRYVGR